MDPVVASRLAGLRHVRCHDPGIRRVRRGGGFVYVASDGRGVRDPDVLRRIRRLVIPPAWREVWICRDPNGHLQAAGRDAKGRRQYRYHPDWRAVRDTVKYGRLLDFGRALPRIRARVARDVRDAGLTRRKVLATIVRLLETTLVRVGNEEYAKHNGSFGLTTLRDDHVHIAGGRIRFRFPGKAGKWHSVELHDRRLAAIVKRCRDLPGYELFQYVDDRGRRQAVESGDVNAYLREISGDDCTAKDFRTWAGTVLAALALSELGPPASGTAARRNIVRAIERVAERLGNTPAISRKSYVHPAVLDAYRDGVVAHEDARSARRLSSERGLSAEERAVLDLLQRQLGRRTDRDGTVPLRRAA